MAAPADPIDYAAVLKDLEARKAVLEATIANVKQMMGLQVQGGASAGTLATQDETADLRNHPFLGMSIGEAAKKYLLMAKRKQTVKEIAEALERGGLHHTSPNFQATVATMVHRYAKNDPDMLSTGKGEWALAAWYGNRRPKAEPPKRKRAKTKAAKTAVAGGAHVHTGPTAKELAEEVLRNAKEPMHVDAILKAIHERRGITVRRGSLVTMLSAYVKAGKVFERTGPGTFALAGAA